MTRVAVLGLGTMGGRVAAQLVGAGHQVTGFDPVAGARERAAAAGVSTGTSAAAVLPGAELVVLSLPRPEHVLEVATRALPQAHGAVVADLSTIDPGTARRVAALLEPHGVTYVDAPVLGRPDKVGRWTLAVGGAEEAVGRVRAVLQGPVAQSVLGVGGTGAGSTVKLVNNLMFGAINAVSAEALAICRQAGVEPATFVSVVADSGAATVSNLFRELAPKMLLEDYDPSFALALLAKDNRLALELAREVGVPAPVAEVVDRLNTETLDLGHGSRDTGVVQELYRARTSAPR